MLSDLSLDPQGKILVSRAKDHIGGLGYKLANEVSFSADMDRAAFNRVESEIQHKCEDARASFTNMLCTIIGLGGRLRCLVDVDSFDFTTSGLVLEGANEFISYGVNFDARSQTWSVHS